ncbi:hypothetical protein D9M72_393600 [compost metagenome]
MALFGNVERIAVIGAERQMRRQALGDDGHQRVQILGDRAFAHQDVHALADLLHRLLSRGAFMVGADAGGEVAVQVLAGQQRRVAVDMRALKGVELGEADRVLVHDAGEIHELGEADDFWMVAERQKPFDWQIGARRLQMCRRHAGRELDADVHDRFERRIEEELDAFGTEHVCDLVRVADDGRDAERQDAAVEFMRCHERRFDVQMRVDEAGHDDAAGNVDFLASVVVAEGADDAVT